MDKMIKLTLVIVAMLSMALSYQYAIGYRNLSTNSIGSPALIFGFVVVCAIFIFINIDRISSKFKDFLNSIPMLMFATAIFLSGSRETWVYILLIGLLIVSSFLLFASFSQSHLSTKNQGD